MLVGLVVVLLVLEIAEDVEGCRVVRAPGTAGGPMEVLVPVVAGRAFDPAEGARVWDGVPVRDADALGGPLVSLVGDLVGD